MSEMLTLSERLRAAMAVNKQSHSDIALSMGKGRSTVTAWANGTHEPSLRELEQLALCLNVSVIWLTHGKGDMVFVSNSELETGSSVQEVL
jgi:transcriptional regulator with XRE-family HTH domain